MPFYAIGVFTGFAMAGYGLSKHHLTQREPGWRRRTAINLSAGSCRRSSVIGDDSGEIKVTFGPGHGGDDIEPGQVIRLTGKAHQTGSRPTSIANPVYLIVENLTQEP